MNQKNKFIAMAAAIAAIYCVLTLVFAPISFREIQFRISEIMTVLPFFTPAAIPGLFVGCVLANIASPLGPIDMAVGGAASLIAAYLTRKMPNKALAPLPPVIVNGIFVGVELHLIYKLPLLLTMLYVALGEAAVCYLLGLPFLFALEKLKGKLF
ncbi:MAG TPA: QueT transporter family protein [Clostridia bacterium]|nr:QueT transporter family protein [Clostridia bacterium]